MRKNFLILMLMALLPLAGWAADLTVSGTLTALSPYYGQDIPAVTVTFGGTPLTLNTEYTFDGYFTTEACAATDAITADEIKAADAGITYYAKVTGINGYEGSLVASFEVKKMPLKLTGTATAAATKTFGENDAEGSLYTITKVEENVTGGTDLTTALKTKIAIVRDPGEDAGTYDLIATITDDALAGNYTIENADITDGTNQVKFTINAKAITATGISIADIPAVTYNGKEQKPALTITDGTTTLVVDNTTAHAKDYYVEYSNNINAGSSATATITGTNNYTGTKAVTFTINQAPLLATPSATKEYDGTNTLPANITYTYQGFVDAINSSSVDASSVSCTASGLTTSGEKVGQPKSYALTIEDASAFTITGSTNYYFIAQEGTFEITKRQITVTGKDYLTQLYGTAEVFDVADAAVVTGSFPSSPASHVNFLKLALKGVKTEQDPDAIDDSYDYDLVPAFRTKAEYEAAITAAGLSSSTTPKLADANKYVPLMASFYEIVPTGTTNGKLKYTNAALSIALKESAYTAFYKDSKLQKVYDGEPIAIELDKENGLQIIGKKNDDVIDLTGLTLTVVDNAADAATYQLELAGAVAEHYDITYIPSQFEITKRALKIKTLDQNFVVGGSGIPVQTMFEYVDIEDDDNDGLASTDTQAEVFELQLTGSGITLDTDKNITAGTTGTIEAVALTATGKKGNNYTITMDTPKGVATISATALTLDRTDTELADKIETADGTTPTVLFGSRALEAEKWNSFILPFEIKVAQLSQAFGYAIVNLFDEANSTATDVRFKLHMGTIPANTPFLMKTADAINTKAVSITGVTIVDPEAPSVTVGSGDVKFIGIYEKTAMAANNTFPVNSGNDAESWKKGAAGVNLNPLAAYIETPASAGAPTIYVEDIDGSVTAISTINAEGVAVEKDGWYTVNGMKLESAPTQKGVYIRNGKKFVVK